MIFRSVNFREMGFNPNEWPEKQLRVIAIDMACQFLMDGDYAEFNEGDVITDYRSIAIDWVARTVIVEVNQLYKPEYLH